MTSSDPKPARTGNWFLRHKVWTGVIALIVLIVIIAIAGGGGKTNNTTSASVDTPTSATNASATAASATTAPSTTPPTTAAPTTTTIPARKVTGKAVTLGAGNFRGGTDVQPGLYDVTPGAGQTGNFIVQGTDTYDEILGSDGVAKVRAQISAGDSIQISSLSQVSFTPVTSPLITTHTLVNLYAGTWTVGQDLGAGRYVATPGAGQTGNFIVENEMVDELLGTDGVPNVSVDLQNGDVITIGSLNQVTMTPK